MTFIDTNYFLRFLLEDNQEQYTKAKHLLQEGAEGKINLVTSTIVFFELNWVLSSYYGRDKLSLLSLLQKILNLDFINFTQHQLLQTTLNLYRNLNLSLEDCYNLAFAKAERIKQFCTFDKKLSKEFTKISSSTGQ